MKVSSLFDPIDIHPFMMDYVRSTASSFYIYVSLVYVKIFKPWIRDETSSLNVYVETPVPEPAPIVVFNLKSDLFQVILPKHIVYI